MTAERCHDCDRAECRKARDTLAERLASPRNQTATVARQKAANDCARNIVDWRARALAAEHALDIAEGTASMVATDRDDAMADADRVADDWETLRDAARAALTALPDAIKPFGVFQELRDECAKPMGVKRRTERYRAALQAIAEHPHRDEGDCAAELRTPIWVESEQQETYARGVDDGQEDGHRCAAMIAREALAAVGGEGGR